MRCILCDKDIKGIPINGKVHIYGHNPAPLSEDGRCCDDCNYSKVLPERLTNIIKGKKEPKINDEEGNKLILTFLGWSYNGSKMRKGNMSYPISHFDFKVWNELIPLYSKINKKIIKDDYDQSFPLPDFLNGQFNIAIEQNSVHLAYSSIVDFLHNYYKFLKLENDE